MATHSSVLDLYLKMGYTKTDGVCQGVSLRWIEACILGECKQFQERIKRIETLAASNQDILKVLNETKAKKGKNLTVKDEELLDILTFFDSMELYHSPEEHSDIFNIRHQSYQHDLQFISTFASSDKIRALGGLTEIYSEPAIKTPQEIKPYLNKLRLAIKAAGAQSETLGIVINNSYHTIALTYKADAGWGFMDINQYPAKFYQLNNTATVAELIAAGFPGNPIAFNTAIVTAKNNPLLSKLTEQLNQFKSRHVITKKIAARESNGVSLAFIAAQHNHVNVITKLAKNKADLNKATPEGKTPAYIAAEFGHLSIITELAKHGADFNIGNLEGETPAYIAAQNGHARVVIELAKNKAKLNKANKDGITPAYVAARFGYASVIAALGERKANLNQKTKEGWSPAHVAAQYGHAHVIKELANYKADLNIVHKKNGMTPAFLAALYGHAQVITELAKNNVDLNRATVDGKTPAYIAAEKGHASVLAQLINHGANLTLPYTCSAKCLREFASSHTADVISRMEHFLNQRLATGTQTIAITPYDIAKIMGHEKVIQLLETNNIGNAVTIKNQHPSVNRNSFFNKSEELTQKNSSRDTEMVESTSSWGIIEVLRSLCPR